MSMNRTRLPAHTLLLAAHLCAGALASPAIAGGSAAPSAARPLAEAHVGKIVFATRNIEKDAQATFPLARSFRLGEQIYVRSYYATTAKAALGATPACQVEDNRRAVFSVAIDGGAPQRLESRRVGPKTWETYLSSRPTGETGAVFPLDAPFVFPMDQNTLRTNLTLALVNLADGAHKVKLIEEARCEATSKTVAEGEFEIKVDAAGRAKVAAQLQLAAAGLAGPELERLTAAAKAAFNKTKVRHVRAIQPTWVVKKGVDRRIMLLSLLEEGGRCTLRASQVVEPFLGGSSYGPPSFQRAADARIGALEDLVVPCAIDVSK